MGMAFNPNFTVYNIKTGTVEHFFALTLEEAWEWAEKAFPGFQGIKNDLRIVPFGWGIPKELLPRFTGVPQDDPGYGTPTTRVPVPLFDPEPVVEDAEPLRDFVYTWAHNGQYGSGRSTSITQCRMTVEPSGVLTFHKEDGTLKIAVSPAHWQTVYEEA